MANPDHVTLARFVGVGPNKTLILEQPGTVVFGPDAKTIVPPAAPGNDGVPAPAAERTSRYSLLGCLGKGAMGEVHVARDEDLLRKVAFKRMVPEVAGSHDLAARFFSEIQVTAQLDHPHIVPIYGLEVTDGNALGYSMKLVQGKTLAKLFEEARDQGPSGAERQLAMRIEIFLKVCDAIAYAHSKGVLHRDLKPENIMVGKYNEVYVMDWGICRVIGAPDGATDAPADQAQISSAHDRTQFGVVMGTPAYMSPEQAAGKIPDLDGRSDEYALGLILHEAIPLRPPVSGGSLEEVLAKAREGRKDPLDPRAPRELRAIVARATAPAAADRYPTVAAMAEDVRRFLRGAAVEAAPDNAAQRAARFLGRHRAGTLAALLVVILVGAGATIGVLAQEQRALAAAHAHEQRLANLLAVVARQAHAIDGRFYRHEERLAALAARASEALARARGAPPDVAYFTNDDYADQARQPHDVQPIIKFAPGVDNPGDARLLASLAPALADAVRDESPIVRAFVTLETGVHVAYPGAGGYPASYDGRNRPKYQLAARKPGGHFGNPYVNWADGRRTLLPMSMSLWGADGAFLGVAGLDTTFETIADQLLAPRGRADVSDAWLLDEHGRVVVHWSRGGAIDDARAAPRTADLSDEPIALAPIGYPEIGAAVAAGTTGLVPLAGGTAAVERLSSLGWFYVVRSAAR